MNNANMLTISQPLFNQISTHCVEGFPREVVGILAGKKDQGTVLKVKPLVNERSETRNRYKVSGLVVYRATQELESDGYDVLGYYHSHPNHTSQYSEYDREHALPNLSYVIVSVMDGDIATTQSWLLTDDRCRMDEQPICIT